MSTKKVTPDNFEAAIKEILDEYEKETVKGVKDATIQTGKATVQLVKANIAGAGIGGTKYRNSFKDIVTEDTPFATTVTIHSPKHYRLVHLLEHGHRKVIRGKARPGRARAFPHMAPAEQEAADLLEKKVTLAIRG